MDRLLKDSLLGYEIVSLLRDNERSYVSLVKKSETDELYIKKIVKNRDVSKVYKIIQELDHMFIPHIEAVEYLEPHTYIIEEYILGESLEERIARLGRLEAGEVKHIFLQLCEILQLMHNLPQLIIHRDIKPSNIIYGSNNMIKIIDFDIARLYDKEKSKDTRMFGTEGYASPEQYGYHQTDTRSDIYSLGILLSVALTGQEPDNQKTMYRGKYHNVIKKCTEINPRDRFQTVDEVRKEFIWSYRNRKRIVFFLVAFIFITAFVVVDRRISNDNVDKEEVQNNDVIENNTDDQVLKPIPTKTPLQKKYECYDTEFEYEKYRDYYCKDVYAKLTESVSDKQISILEVALKNWYSETDCDSGAWTNWFGDKHIITPELIDGNEYGIVYINESQKGDKGTFHYIEIYWYYLHDINKRIYYSKWSEEVTYMVLYHNYYNGSSQKYYSIDFTFDYGPDAG